MTLLLAGLVVRRLLFHIGHSALLYLSGSRELGPASCGGRCCHRLLSFSPPRLVPFIYPLI